MFLHLLTECSIRTAALLNCFEMKMDLSFFICPPHFKSPPPSKNALTGRYAYQRSSFCQSNRNHRFQWTFTVNGRFLHIDVDKHQLSENIQRLPRLWGSEEPASCQGRKSTAVFFYSPAMPLFFIFFSSFTSPVVARDAGSRGPSGEIVIWTI